MKAKKIFIAAGTLLILSTLFTSCYRKKIPLDESRASQQVIPIEEAKQYQKRFLESHRALAGLIKDSSYLDKSFIIPNAETFNRDVISLLLNQEGADGIRFYFGQNEKGEVKLVMLPVDKDGKDIVTTLLANTTALKIPGISTANAQSGAQAGENSQVCPPCMLGSGSGAH